MTEATKDLFRGRLVRLAEPSVEDPTTFARWSEDANYLRALDTDYARPLSAKELAERLAADQADPHSVAFRLRTLVDDRLIGFVVLHAIEWNNRTALLAMGIGESSYRDKGHGTDALQVVLRYAFNELNLFRVGLDVIASNTRAIHTYAKAGF
jgi:RimJ/RimL family protein N-acetyltransferase